MSEKKKDEKRKDQPQVNVRDLTTKKDPKGGPGGTPPGRSGQATHTGY